MQWTIGKRLFVAFIGVSLLLVGLTSVATRWSFQQGFVQYLGDQETERLSSVVDALTSHYQIMGSWQAVGLNPRLWDDIFRDADPSRRAPPMRPLPDGRRAPPGARPPGDPMDLRARVSLLDSNGGVVFGPPIAGDQHRRLEIAVDGEVIGALIVRPQLELSKNVDLNFAREQSKSAIYIGLAAVLFAAMIAALVSRQMVRPIAALAAATRSLAAGNFDQRLTVARDDELGDLARDFNKLTETLQSSQLARKQWVSDIAHELRTPLAILQGELEAVEDGLRQFDEGTRLSLQAEVGRLSKLVADLHELTLSDEGGLSYNKAPVLVAGVMQDCIEKLSTGIDAKGLTLDFSTPATGAIVSGDASRLEQLFTNLLENAIRYTTSPGKIAVSVTAENGSSWLWSKILRPGSRRDQYARLFDRLYRADRSRNRNSGGSGLGLSICKSVAEAHGGEIIASASDLGGVRIVLSLPVAHSEKGSLNG